MSNMQLIASIIQGEAGEMGPIGMMAVALSISCRMWQHDHSVERIAREYYGRAEPDACAKLLAQLVLDDVLPDNDYYFVMGHECDVQEQDMKRGEWVVMNQEDTMGLHLYSIDNVPWEVTD